jgi:purine-binding chemotaxis protein CheW
MSERRQFSTFLLEGLFFGVEVERVQEVIRYQRMTQVPLAPIVIRGLINLRGQIVTAIDLRRRLGMSDLNTGCLPMNVVIRYEDGAVSLLVDEIGDVLEVEESSFERPPDTLQGTARELIRGAYKLKDRLLLALNIDRVLCVDGVRDGSRGSRAISAHNGGQSTSVAMAR